MAGLGKVEDGGSELHREPTSNSQREFPKGVVVDSACMHAASERTHLLIWSITNKQRKWWNRQETCRWGWQWQDRFLDANINCAPREPTDLMNR